MSKSRFTVTGVNVLITQLKRKEEDYETALSALVADIKKRQLHLSEIRLRERRATLLVTLYTLAAWVAYVSLWYIDLLPYFGGRHARRGGQRFLGALPVLLGPIIRIVQIWYTRKGDAEERTLQRLVKQQREKVEEIKKKTNYYSTRELLQRYDETSPAGSPMQQRSGPSQPPTQPSTPKRPPPEQNNGSVLRTPTQGAGATPSPPQPPRKQWLDKIVDVVLGDDDAARFALICEKCFSHNGLVKESVWEDTQYVCPKCKHFNPSKRSKRLGTAPSSPVSPSGGVSLSAAPSILVADSPSSSSSRSPVSQSLRQRSQPKSPLRHAQDVEVEDESMMDVVED
ncbi:hypothetical protein D9757_007431 [Collybiopsis confluens]|uniref:Endoplasmic reticulum junction formation protein lunapark n=1 Tax=Collybiopsis confluens TaxID=2823264 RepID=A0A8H5M7U9_9AGAR|nr:hypothetical protein D9757_007431 [Collybiopsis confluens]